ncbi:MULTISPECIES: serine/threonine-protein kinase [unclassified Micromonospora]|uniref:serine/threonine-protein kinase n=1 Tax=unclassified Micromonospora TaxID=2617518 RepID=UPI00188E5D77|nr:MULTISPECIES: serine/threonine-protein kinase [unclassified Micromonospora]MBF5031924.1 serine/threonine protein kinase [Micromonospora sp. ANENR4]MCZ7475111.1 serine/threonine-protein kinase [Micromonospora sp. WMMC273]WBC05731.1 serine/threonine-protein kinase [Micromonospora sp. WMMA1976]
MSPFTPALRLHDRYVLRERIGLGGMSEVWRADDEVLHRPVAVKALAGQLAADPQLRAVIQREARAAARLTHPHVTQVYDYGEATLDRGVVVPYLVMELVEGQTLADRLNGGPLAWPDAVRTAGQVAGALAAAHRIGVVHRDVKPANVMLTETGAKVLDFGIAAPAGPHPVTGQTGALLMGTPAYFAPERLDPGPANPAGDVYALGVLLYRSLTGLAPLPVRSWDDVLDVRRNRPPVPPPRVPGLPPEIADLVLACLDVDPERRPTAARLADRLGAGRPVDPPTAILPTVAPAAHPPTLVERSPAAASRSVPPARPVAPPRPAVSSNRLLGLLVAGALVLLLAVVGSLVWGDGSGTPPAAAPTAGPSTGAAEPPAPEPSSAAPPSTVPEPVTLRQLGDRFGELIDRAESIGLVDRKTADDLRKKAAELDRGKPKDRGKRVEDLREKIDDAAEDEKIDPVTATALRKLLDGYERLRGGTDEG